MYGACFYIPLWHAANDHTTALHAAAHSCGISPSRGLSAPAAARTAQPRHVLLAGHGWHRPCGAARQLRSSTARLLSLQSPLGFCSGSSQTELQEPGRRLQDMHSRKANPRRSKVSRGSSYNAAHASHILPNHQWPVLQVLAAVSDCGAGGDDCLAAHAMFVTKLLWSAPLPALLQLVLSQPAIPRALSPGATTSEVLHHPNYVEW